MTFAPSVRQRFHSDSTRYTPFAVNFYNH